MTGPCPACYPPLDLIVWSCGACDTHHYSGSPDEGCRYCGEIGDVFP